VICLTKQEWRVLLTVAVLLATGLATKMYRAWHPAAKETPPMIVIRQTAP
jgi:hypothetical protein